MTRSHTAAQEASRPMPDYGHELRLGTFITPQSQRPQDVVALAQLSEQSGLDLVTFQDHPYQPAFLDTWTLLSWVAAQTERIHVAPDVLNLPLRPPAVLARAAASLDLLSGGRFELGLGAGGFWDAIAAMGGPRRTPGESVDALERGDRHHPPDLGRRRARRRARRGRALPRRRRQARPGAGPRHPDLARRVQAADAAAHSARRPTAGCPRLPYIEPGMARAGERADRRGGGGRRPRPARDPAPAQLDVVGAGAVDELVEQLCRSSSSTASARSSSGATTRARSDVRRGGRARAARGGRARAPQRGTPTGPVRGRPRSRSAGRASTTTPSRPASRPSSPATAPTRRSARRTSGAARPGSSCGRETPTRWPRRSPTRASRTSRSPSAAAGTASAAARPTTAASSSTSASSTASRSSTADRVVRARAGRALGRRRAGPAAARARHELGRLRRRRRRRARDRGRRRLPRPQARADDRPRHRRRDRARRRRSSAPTPTDRTCSGRCAARARTSAIVTAFELEAYPVGNVVLERWLRRARHRALLERWGAIVEAAPRELTSFLSLAPQQGVAQLYTVVASDDTEPRPTR